MEQENGLCQTYAEVIKQWRVGFPTVHVEADFTRPLHFGDVTTIELSVGRLGRSSVRMRYCVRRQPEGARCAEARLTTVCVDMDTFRARAIPDRLRKVFLRFRDPDDADEAEGGEGDGGGETIAPA